MYKKTANGNVRDIIFDFDGTLADTFSIFVETLEGVLGRETPFSDDEIADLRDSSTREIMKKLGVTTRHLPAMAIKGRRLVANKMDSAHAFNGIPEAIESIHDYGYRLHILSTNDENAIRRLLARERMIDNFVDVYAGTSLFGKARKLAAFIKKDGLIAEQCVYVGDETRDIEAARKVGTKCIAVGWGYNTPEILKSYKPDEMVLGPSDLLNSIQSL